VYQSRLLQIIEKLAVVKMTLNPFVHFLVQVLASLI